MTLVGWLVVGPVSLQAAVNPVADYHFDECQLSGSGYEIIDHLAGNNGRAVGGVETDDGGAIERFIDFRLAGQNLVPQTAIALGSSWSVSVWIKTPFISPNRYHVLGSVRGGGDLMFVDRNRNYRWGVYGPAFGVRYGSYELGGLNGGWHHLVLVGAFGRTTLYVDGDPKDVVDRQTSGDLVYLGTSWDGYGTSSAQGFGLPCDELLVLSSDLTPPEIRQLYQNQLAGLNFDGSERAEVSCDAFAPVAEYRLDECLWDGTTGEVKDSSGNSLHGTAVLSPVSIDVSGEAGGVCRAASMGGVSHLAIPDNDLLDITDNLTAMAWVRPDTIPASSIKSILSKDTNYEFHINRNGEIYWWWRSGGQAYTLTTSSADMIVGDWYHVAVRFQAGTATIFVNGQPSISRSGYPVTLDTNRDPLQIGGDYIGNRYFEGIIDEVMVFASALDDNAIQAIYVAQGNDKNYDNSDRLCPTTCDDLEDTVTLSTTDSGGQLGQPPLTLENGDLVEYTISSQLAVLLAQPAAELMGADNEVNGAHIGLDGTIYFTPSSPLTTPQGAAFAGADDILAYNPATDAVEIAFNGSDHFGGSGVNIDGFHRLDNGNYILTTSGPASLGGLSFGKADLVEYNPTTRSASLYFTGADHFTEEENIDGIFIVDENFMLLSTETDAQLGALSFRPGDLILYAPTPRVASVFMTGANEFSTPQNIDAITVAHNTTVIDHYEIIHDGVALTCNPEDIQIAACLTSDCSVLLPRSATVTMTPTGWVGGDLVRFIGSDDMQLRHTTPESITLGLQDPLPTTINGYRCVAAIGGPSISCEMQFFESGFEFSVPTQVSGKESEAITISAVRTDETSIRCVPAFANRRARLGFWSAYLSPASGSLAMQVDSTAIAGSPPGTGIVLDFDDNGQAQFRVRYDDAGSMELNARFLGQDEEAGLVMTGNDSFVVHPAGLCVESGDADSDCASGDGSCSAFVAAGTPFHLTVKGVAWEANGEVDAEFCDTNRLTPNYRHTNILLAHTLIAPLSGEAGTIGVATLDIGDGGTTTIEQLVSEVGVFTFTADPPADYLGAGDVFGGATFTSEYIGRFIPDHFAVSILPDPPSFANSCVVATYLGEPFDWALVPELSIVAKNGADPPLTTANYEGDFFKLDPALRYTYTDLDVPAIAAPLTPTSSSQTMADTADCGGTVTLELVEDDKNDSNGVRDGFNYTRPAPDIPVTPFSPRVRLTVPLAELTDGDGVCFDGGSGCTSFVVGNIGGIRIRHGRALAEDVYGPETDALIMPISVFYYDGGNWILNPDDDCSSFDYGLAGSGLSGTGDPAPPVTMEGGRAPLTLTPAAGSGRGTVTVGCDFGVWLEPDPSAVATFGISRGNDRILNWQEIMR